MSSPRLNFILAGSIAGIVIVIGEGLLNGLILMEEWTETTARLGLSEPSMVLVLLGFAKLFVLGYVVVWLYDVFAMRHGEGWAAAMRSGAVIAGLVWVWVMLGLLMAGFVTWRIAWITIAWGVVEIPLAAIVAARFRTVGRASSNP